MTVLATCIQYRIGSSYLGILGKKKKEASKLKRKKYFYSDDMISYVENSQETTKNVRANK